MSVRKLIMFDRLLWFNLRDDIIMLIGNCGQKVKIVKLWWCMRETYFGQIQKIIRY